MQEVNFPSISGEKLSGALFRPERTSTGGKSPAVVLGHGLGAIKEMGLQNYAERFASRGYVALTFDYRHFGHSEGQPRQLLEPSKQLQDWKSALSYVTSLEFVDPEQVAVFGSSFGGGHAIVTAAEDARVKAAIAQCPFTSGFHSALQLSPLSVLPTAIKGLCDLLFGWGNRTFNIALAGHPGESALMNSHDSMDGYLSLVRPEHHGVFANHVAARIAVKILFYYPGAKAKHVQCPILFAVCGQDSVAPAKQTLQYAAQAPRGVIKHFEEMGHFSIYSGQQFETAMSSYLQFLDDVMPVTTTRVNKL
ncbi:unnamed protein product [Parajaminaea phylloscopi]